MSDDPTILRYDAIICRLHADCTRDATLRQALTEMGELYDAEAARIEDLKP